MSEESDPTRGPKSPSLGSMAKEQPLATASLIASMLAGILAAYLMLGDDWAHWRRIAGGASAGVGSWLLVMVGRLIDE